MLLWLFFFTVLTVLLLIFLIFYFVSGGMVWFPGWLVEIMLSFYWYSAIGKVLKDKYFDPTRLTPIPPFYQSLVVYCFLGHAAAAYALSLGILPWLTDSIPRRILTAYLGSLFVLVYAPMAGAEFWYPRWVRKQEAEAAGAEEIASLALACPAARRFAELFPGCRVYVFNNKVKNAEASCLLAYRRERTERPGLWEEFTLEIPVAWRSRNAACERIQPGWYIFQSDDDGSTVMHLPDPERWESHAQPRPLEEAWLERFDRMVNRYPPMGTMPFRLAVHPVPWREMRPAV
ncbi:MAG: hypothetical protein ACE15F_21285 [bacterium]